MNTEIAITVVKVLGALIGGILGAVGLLNKNIHDASGKLTRWGKVVLIGIALSAIVSAIPSIFEAQKELASSREQAARTETLLRELSRSIQPIRELTLTYFIEVPQGSKIVDAYVARLSAGIEKRIPFLKKIATPNDAIKGLHTIGADVDDEPLVIEIKPESDLWPRDDEAVIATIARSFTLTLDIFKTPITPEEYYRMHGTSDFGVVFSFPQNNVLHWHRMEKQLELFGKTNIDKTLWATNGRVTSIVDLYGAQILLFPPNSNDLPGYLLRSENEIMKELSRQANVKVVPMEQQMELSRSMDLRTISFEFGEGRSIWIRENRFKKSAYKNGYPVFSVTLPKDETEFREFTR